MGTSGSPWLKADVNAQAGGGTPYNPDSLFTVLRIYQFYPDFANAGVVQKILLMVRHEPRSLSRWTRHFYLSLDVFSPMEKPNPSESGLLLTWCPVDSPHPRPLTSVS
jgi:hypothetical protein